MHTTRILPLCWINLESNNGDKMGMNESKQLLQKMQELHDRLESERSASSKERFRREFLSTARQFKQSVEKL